MLEIFDNFFFCNAVINKPSFVRFLLGGIKCPVVLCDEKGKIIYWSSECETLLGYNAKEVIGKDICKVCLFKNESGKEFENFIKSACANKYECELLSEKKDGSLFGVHVEVVPFRDDNGEVEAYRILFVVEQKSLLDRLRWRNCLLEIINKCDNWQKSVIELLEMLGELAKVSSVYIFQRKNDEQLKRSYLTLKYEWCANGIPPQINNPMFKKLDYAEFGFEDWESSLLKGDYIIGKVSDLSDEKKPLFTSSMVKSFIFVPINVNGDSWGVLGFDDSYCEREWSASEIELLTSSAAVLSETLKRVSIAEELEKSERRWQIALEGSGDGVWDWNVKDDRIFTSKQMLEVFGYSEKSNPITIERIISLVHQDERNKLQSAIKTFLETEIMNYAVEYRLACRDGSYKWVLVKGKKISFDDNNKALRVVGTISDITDRKRIEKELIRFNSISLVINLASENFLSKTNFDENINYMLTHLGIASESDSVSIYKNDAKNKSMAMSAYRWSKNGACDQTNCVEFNFNGNLLIGWAVMLSKGNIVYGNYSSFNETDSAFFIDKGIKSLALFPIMLASKWWGFLAFESFEEREWSASELNILSNASTLIGAAIRRKQDEDALLESEKKYRQLVELSQEGVLLINGEGFITFANFSFLKMTGYTAREVINFKAAGIISKESSEEFFAILNLNNNMRKKDHNINFISKSGAIIYTKFSLSPVCDENNQFKAFLCLIADITDVRNLENRIKETQKEILEKYTFEDIAGKSKAMREIFELLPAASDTNCNVLIEGPSGTGKNLIAKTIHNISERKSRPFVTVNCAALPETLLESELFGYVKGAFTDAKGDKPGKFALASDGTIFLDEIGDMPLHLQVKLLRVIEDKCYEPLGGVNTVKADVRIIAATNKNLTELIEIGRFREDLYYRLKIIHIKIPSLRERKEDIEVLVNKFIEILNVKHLKNIQKISIDVLRFFNSYEFPGNVRELQNMLERAFIFCKSDEITADNFANEYKTLIMSTSGNEERNIIGDNNLAVYDEKEKILSALAFCHYNRIKTAEYLKISRTQLWRKLKKLNISIK